MYSVGELIQDRYKVSAILHGGMGLVYVCHDLSEHRLVALKTLQDHLITQFTGMERFVREARTWIMLGRHLNIVHASKVEQIQGLPYVFMEYVAGYTQYGSSLRGWILHRGLDVALSIDVVVQVCNGLSYAQRRMPGIVHRDLKPENILITYDKVAKVSDFGLVKAVADQEDFLDCLPEDEIQEFFQATLTRSGRVVGTPPYMSPEQCIGEHLDCRSDIYAIGCVLYESLTGRWLLDSQSPSDWLKWHIYGTPTPPSKLSSNVPPFLDEIVLHCLEKKPHNRYIAFDELARDLEDAYCRLTGLPYSCPRTEDELSESESDEQIDQATSFMILGERELALEELDRVLATNPNSFKAWSNKGIVLSKLERHEESLACLDKALTLQPHSVEPRINKAVVYLQLGDLDEAIALLREVLKLDPQASRAWVNLGTAHQFQGKNLDALEHYDTALAIDPWSPEAWVNRGNILSQEGRSDEAKLSYRQALLHSVSFLKRTELAFWLVDVLDSEEVFEFALRSLDRIPADQLLEKIPGAKVDDLKPLLGDDTDQIVQLPGFAVALAKMIVLPSKLTFYYRSRRTDSETRQVIEDIHTVVEEWLKISRQDQSDQRLVNRAAAYLYLFCAMQLIGADAYEPAINMLDKVLEHGLDAGIVWGMYGFCLYVLNRWEEALDCIEKSLDRASQDGETLGIRDELLDIRRHIVVSQSSQQKLYGKGEAG